MRILIAGAGEVGFHLAKDLAMEGQDVVLIDPDRHHLEHASNTLDIQTVEGDATCPNTLSKAGISNASLLVAATNLEARNMAICTIGKQLGVERTIARISNLQHLRNKQNIDYQALGIDIMISPTELAALEILRLVEHSSFTDHYIFGDNALHLVGIRLASTSSYVGHPLMDMRESGDVRFIPVSIKRGTATLIPRGSTILEVDDFVYFVCITEALDKVASLDGIDQVNMERVMVLGGSRIGARAAELLSKEFFTKLVEIDRDKAVRLTDELPNTLVLNGDGRNVDFLEEEDISATDLFIAVTGQTETNIMSCLVAKSKGVKKTIALVENIDYMNFSQAVGVDTMLNKKLIAANSIFRFVRKGSVVSVASIRGVDAEVLEFEVNEKSKVINKPIRELKIPKGAIIGGVIRDGIGKVTLGDFIILPGDHVVVFTMPDNMDKVERFFR